MQIRLAGYEDFSMLASLRYAFCNEMGDGSDAITEHDFCQQFITFLTQGLADNTWYYYIAEQNQELLGHVFIKTVTIPPRPNHTYNAFGYLTNMYVKPAYRNQQIGNALLQYAINQSKLNGMELLIVWPDDKSIAFYERMGFALNEVRELRF